MVRLSMMGDMYKWLEAVAAVYAVDHDPNWTKSWTVSSRVWSRRTSRRLHPYACDYSRNELRALI